ncbi:MAG: anaerobic ribonucleoside-triphosphate reductase activating protein [Oscillospiraceae bacterium]|nr:anaerobic ribonucleoside-triphosphate reductase activating protein [Oscillospiraceae bacterium]
MEIRIAGTVEDSIVDGPGLRFVVFVQGCPHHCEGCHNPETHDFSGGRITDTDAIYEHCMENPLAGGVTFSGGEPFCQAHALYELGSRFKAAGKHLMCYSGWTFEELLKKSETEEYTGKLLGIIDILVDGRFDISKRLLSLQFRGSANQRLIDVPASLSSGSAVVIPE